jgi:hypothetical protein
MNASIKHPAHDFRDIQGIQQLKIDREAGPQYLTKWYIKKNEEQTNELKAGYAVLYIEMEHTNNSTDKLITRLYDKNGSVTVSFLGRKEIMPIKSVKVNRVYIESGQKYRLYYTMLFKQPLSGNWSITNKDLLSKQVKKVITTFTYDVAVKWVGI